MRTWVVALLSLGPVGCAARGQLGPSIPAAAPAMAASPTATATPTVTPAATERTTTSTSTSTSTDATATEEPQPPAHDPYDSADEPAPRCPPEMALLPDDVCIDRWEGSLVELLADGEERPWSPFQTLGKSGVAVRAVSLPGVVPQGHISGEQAEGACRASGKRLCSAAEWETACMGPRRTTYPYGDIRRKHVCNDDGRYQHPVVDLTKRLGLSEAQMWRENMDHPMLNQLPDTLTKTGERAGCTNEYGAYDMVGNLHEWIEDADGTFRGGFYMDTRINGEGCNYATTAHGIRYHDYSTGFRCCKDALGAE